MRRGFLAAKDAPPFATLPAVASVILTVVSLAAFPPGGVSRATGGSGATRLLIVEGALADAGAAREAIRAVGGRPLHAFPPDAVIAWLPDGADGSLRARWPGLAVYADGALPPRAYALPPAARRAATVWRSRGAAAEAKSGSTETASTAPPPLEHGHDAFVRPSGSGKGASGAAASGGPPGAGFWDLSEFMLGDVTLSILAVESDGSLDPNSEDWTAPRLDKVIVETAAALDWWIARAGTRPLSFTYHIATVGTGFEPITHPQLEEGLWITDAMANLGYAGGDHFDRVAAYDNAQRDADGTDWAVCAFVVDSWNDADGKFTDGYFAYAYLGGPFLVMTYDNDGWGADNMDAVLAHEMAHAFYALDEYAAAGVACTQRSGYLSVENGNSAVSGCPANVSSCVMRSSVGLGAAVAEAYTEGQVGWGDADSDGLTDILDTSPEAALDPHVPDPGDPDHATLTGQAEEVALANQNPNGSGVDLTLNVLSLVEWRVDGGAWSPATVADGTWDELTEEFQFTTGLLSQGAHLVETRALNSAGNYGAPDSQVVSVGTLTGVETPGTMFTTKLGIAQPNPARPETEIFWVLGGSGEASLTIHDVTGRRVRALAGGMLAAGPHSARWDGRDDNGREVASGVYLYRLVTRDHDDSRRLILVR